MKLMSIPFANANKLLITNTCFGQVKMNRKWTHGSHRMDSSITL